jgi:hypothetical protein
MNTVFRSILISSILLIIYYFTLFKEETKNDKPSEFLVSIVLLLLLYIATTILIFNIIEVYKTFGKKILPSTDNFMARRDREDTFARLLARKAPDPNNVINPLFDRSPQFLRGPFGPNNPRANQIAYTFFNN